MASRRDRPTTGTLPVPTCWDYHPLFCFNQLGDLERALLRSGNVASADDWLSVLAPVVARYRNLDIRRFFRGDAAFARPELYEYLELESYLYAIRLPANEVLYREIEPFLTRPVGRPPNRPIVWYHDFQYRAGSWDKPRRVVAKIEWHKDELFPGVGFIVTNLRGSAKRVTAFYNRRGLAEQWIKEGKHALNWTRLSCQFNANQARRTTVRAGAQPGQLPASAGATAAGAALVADNAAGEVDQDRGEGGSACQVPDVPTGRGGCAT